MNESTGVTASSLAITEKRPRGTGGCVGIFFQLFDWNRRFAKKKLFSKRLLPPAGGKQASKKFGGDEKLPKLRLIADENSGGFPNVKKSGVSSGNSNEGKNGVQTPSLVARLMGLESLPSVQQDKLNKGSSGEIGGGRREKVVGDNGGFEKGITRQECRPQKLQKTGMVERWPVTRFGAEALQLKNVLSRSRKHHRPKLASPVKSPRHQSGRNTSRLIGAATRILEPGLQARSKAKCAITYTHNARRAMKSENLDLSEHSNYKNKSKLLSGQSSCRNCGNLLDVVKSRPHGDCHSSVYYPINPSSQVYPQDGDTSYISSSINQEQEQVFASDRVPLDLGDRVPSQLKENYLPFNGATSSTNAVSNTKNFVALNRNLSGRTRLRVPAKVEDIKFDNRSEFDRRYDDGLPPRQRRLSTNIRKQRETSRMVSSNVSTGKQIRPNACSLNRTYIDKQPDLQRESNRIGGYRNKNSDDMTFRFSSPMKHTGEVPAKVERRRNQNASPCKTTPRRKSQVNESDDGKNCVKKAFSLTGDSLGALLEEKLRELTFQVENDSRMNVKTPKSQTANIFQELICALNIESSLSQTDMNFSPHRNSLPHDSSHMPNHSTGISSQVKPEALVGYTHYPDHLSPGSVLEASFSNDSCCSSSFEDSSGHILQADSTSYSHNESQPLDSEKDLFQYGVLLNKEKTCNDLVIDLLIHISKLLSTIDLHDTRLKGYKLSHAKEVIFNAELVLRNQTNFFFISHFLLDEHENHHILTQFSNFLGFEASKERNKVKGFFFDFLIEYLDSKFGRYSKCGFRSWAHIPPCMNAEILTREVVEEVQRCMDFVGLITDEVIEKDMSFGLGKWTDFEMEVFENGAEIGGDILENLVDEIVVDLMAGMLLSC